MNREQKLECWATLATDTSQCVQALVLAKSLRRSMTSRPLLIVVSHLIPDDMWQILQFEFDVVLRLDKAWTKVDNLSGNLYGKVFLWSLHKWDRIVFLQPNTMMIRNCDELFNKKEGFWVRSYSQMEVFIMRPSQGLWRKLNDSVLKKGERIEEKVFSQTFSHRTVRRLEQIYNLKVNIAKVHLTRNLNEFGIVTFEGKHPMELASRTEKINGILESGLLSMWTDHLEHGVAQTFSKLENIPVNGLKTIVDKYQSIPHSPSLDCNNLRDYQNSVAIVGMSCRFPGANSLAEFWKLLIEGRDAMGLIPAGRWVPERCPLIPDESKDSIGGFLNCPIDDFDGKFFGISPKELTFMDPQQRLTLQVAWEALEDAGIDPTSLNESYTSVYGGAWRTDYEEALQKKQEFLRSYLGNAYALLTARISHCLGLTGPAVTTESGCSSSIVAVDLACRSLLSGETDLSLACGVNLLIHPFTVKSMHTVLAPDGHCKTFDAAADGFGRAEGCGVLVLKRYADAVRDGDRVWALIRGSAVVQEGASRSLGTPTKQCEALAMSLALDAAGVHPREVSFVETHGTGTAVGDPLEVAAVAEAYHDSKREHPLIIGSVKTNIGHTESCSGIAGIIKVVLSLQNEMIPAHRNFNTLNPLINLDEIPAKIPLEPVPWPRIEDGKPRIAGVSSFGITGTDAHAIIQETPKMGHPSLKRNIPTNAKRPLQILTLSGKSIEAVEDNLRQWKHFLSTSKDAGRILDICHTANVGRGDFQYRAVILGASAEDMLENMKKSVIRGSSGCSTADGAPKICFLFTGQGSQYPGMGKTLYETELTFKMHFDVCDQLLVSKYGINIRDVIWGTRSEFLGRTINSQLAIFIIEICLLRLWESWGIKPSFVLGHSLGEFSAAVASNVLSFEDALTLVVERSRLIDSLPTGKMIVLKQSLEGTEQHMKNAFQGTKNWLDTAAVNSQEQTVLAGNTETVESFALYCKNNGVKYTILDSSHAFHSRHMDPILEKYRNAALTIQYSDPSCTYISGMDGKEVGKIDAEYWVRHTRDRVRFASATKDILSKGCSLFLELGPQPVLSALTMINSSEDESLEITPKCFPSIRKQEGDWSCILNTLGKLYVEGVNVDWKHFDQWNSGEIEKLTVPFYPFQAKKHWFEIPDSGPGVIHPLCGKPVENASAMKMYTQNLTLEENDYLKDHAIGNKVIFPGAGFLEMCLVAGHAATQCTERRYFHPSSPVTLENFTIESPLGLVENVRSQLQSIVSSDDGGETRITIYSKLVLDSDTHKWIKHASAVFHPYGIQTKEEENLSLQTLDDLKSRFKPSSEDIVSEIYDKLSEFGLKFGATFRSIKTMRKSEDIEAKCDSLFEVELKSPACKYIVHPIISDALFQALMFSAGASLVSKLHVPVSVQKFIVFTPLPENTQNCFIHCAALGGDNNEMVAMLYSEEGVLIAQMIGALLMDTTVGAIMSALESQRLCLPAMYEEVWRAQMGSLEKRADLMKAFNRETFEEHYAVEMEAKHNPIPQGDELFNKLTYRLYQMYMIKGLVELGYKEELQKPFLINDLAQKLKVTPGLLGFFRYVFQELEIDGFFAGKNKTTPDTLTFKQIKEFPPMQSVQEEIDSLFFQAHALVPNETSIVSSTGSRLANMLRGTESALSYLFPEDPSAISAEVYYMEAKVVAGVHRMANEMVPHILKYVPKYHEKTKRVIRILEVGAGTGSLTKTFRPHLDVSGHSYEYTYTDLSPVFFNSGEKIFEGSNVKVLYKILNIEDDITEQSFIPFHYDMIISNNVIHATKSIAHTTRNLRNLLRPRGILVVVESVKPARSTNLTFGCLDAYWSYEDFNLRGLNCEISEQKWTQVYKESGFDSITMAPIYGNNLCFMACRASYNIPYLRPISKKPAHQSNQNQWVIFGQYSASDCKITSYLKNYLLGYGKRVAVVAFGKDYREPKEDEFVVRADSAEDIDAVYQQLIQRKGLEGTVYLGGINAQNEGNPTEVVRPYLHICKSIITRALEHHRVFCFTRGIIQIGDQHLSQPGAAPLFAMTKCFKNEIPSTTARVVDLDYGLDIPSEAQLMEAFNELFITDHDIYAAYRNHQRNVVRAVHWKPQNNVGLPFPKGEKFHLVLPGSNAISDLRFGALPSKATILGDHELEIKVKAYALNFRDVFAVLKPSVEFESMNTVGIDWSGEVIQTGAKASKFAIGDRVFGTNLHGGSMPSHLQFKENMMMRIPDKMTYGDAATLPAVGATAFVCLVQIAKLTKDDTILIHAGSGGVGLVAIQIAQHVGARIVTTAGNKRKRTYLRSLGVEHIFNSRSTDYEQEIRKALGGQGVDVVLNSLTSAGFKEASLALCNKGARFVEMSKLNTWSVEEVKALRPDVQYTIADLSAVSDDEMVEHLEGVSIYMDQNIIRPIPHTRFDASEVREALGYLQKAKHIGKIVVTMPQSVRGDIPMFDDMSTYLITGGLGGIGFEVCKWMAASGAKHIALVGRNPPNDKVAEEIKRLNDHGKNVFSLQYDVGIESECKDLLAKLDSKELDLPPLRGIMHAAGVLSDAIYPNQSWEKYTHTYHPKVFGGWNLHNLTMDKKKYPLDHFVMFSSATASLGALGQSNHASANFWLDSLAWYRHSLGLPATSINWGQWGQVGVATNLEVIGLSPFTTLQGISALERVVKSQMLHTVVCDADFTSLHQIAPGSRAYLSELRLQDKSQAREIPITSEQLWNDYDSAKDDADRLDVVRKAVRIMIRQILKLSSDELLNDDENFQDMGMDSLMMIEMKNMLQSLVGKRVKISVNSVKDCHTVNQLTTKLVELFRGDEESPIPTHEELLKLIREDMKLPEDLQAPPISACKPSEIKTLLLTGSTGSMGGYFLRDISNNKNIQKIYCLVRDNARTGRGGLERLEQVLQVKGLLGQTDMSKVVVVSGVITKKKLGMSDELYNELSMAVDAVVHLAVKSSFTDQYKRDDRLNDDIRSVTVGGTKEMLRFVCSQKAKILFHASTLACNIQLGEDKTMAETWPKENDFDEHPNSAYPIAKFICDRLMGQAVEQLGLPIKVFRFPAVGGDGKTGANVDYENNQLMLRLMSYLHMGVMPALPIPFLALSVDDCVDLSLKIFFDDSTPHEMYNVYNPYARNETELVGIGKELGYDIELMELEAFEERLNSMEDSKLIHFLKVLCGNTDTKDRLLKQSSHAVLTAYTTKPDHAFLSKKLAKYLTAEYPKGIENTISVIRRDLLHAKNIGVFAKFGL